VREETRKRGEREKGREERGEREERKTIILFIN